VNPDFKSFMNQVHPPFRLAGEEVGWRFGMNREEVRIISSLAEIARVREALPDNEKDLVLRSATRLKPLGTPSVAAEKFFLEDEIAHLAGDEAWLDRAVRTIRLYWKLKKKRRKASFPEDPSI